ncbi:hypothetical protein CEE37_01885 [candidate division LCP-89 bacterium B3_LCP]|uniref:Secretion system C-terminal sorting domain-containing protein n=1 Tax=candidate division LCP-89 bacterium B3_LCP TaxID=2012998 RepID=A0A532V670_UNCL8|nr:MAG: hypothetical protein CEE37_01885 [candidate division LCP-89 bacterium B3_LCP]
MVAGSTTSYGAGETDVCLIRLDAEGTPVKDPGFIQDIPNDFALYEAHPNPFNPTTTINFELPVASLVELDVFDISGSRVGVACPFGGLAPTRIYTPGTHQITFDGSGLPSGIYIYRLQAGEFSAIGKMVLLK